VQSGCDTVFACGGDGTIHSIVQGLALTPAALAILPMGTANALAHDLGLPMNLSRAAQVLLRARSCRVALGRIAYLDLKGNPGTRYFVVAAGAGAMVFLVVQPDSGSATGGGAVNGAWALHRLSE